MKRAVKILIPILLSLSILLCLAWYLFIYDREFTRDALLSGARYFEAQGNHSVAAWLYDCAYLHAGNNDDVALELAQQYQKAGNYTRAEATLSKAIADGGSAKLYIALSNTYVAQDKLLDAVKLLDGILNPDIQAELNQLRPAAPVATPEPGFYSQYVSVALTSENGTLYTNTDAEYPSIRDDVYSEPIQLVDGENTIYALSVAENGLVSPLSILGYTITGVIEEVSFTDPAIEAQIRAQLAVDEETVIYTNDLWKILSFTVPADATSLADLHYLTFLEELVMSEGVSGQLDVLSSLSNLTTLTISDTVVEPEELAFIGSLPKLQTLSLRGCSLSTIEGLETAVNLQYLDLSNNTIRKLDALASLQSLQQLYLQHNAITSVSKLTKLTNIQALDVSYNNLKTLSPIASITSLTQLQASNNVLTDLSQFDNLTNLTYLDVAYNSITDVSALSACTKLSHLNISNNALSNIHALSTLVNLSELNFAYNQVTELPALPAVSSLVAVDGSHNLITALDPLSGLGMLNNVYMDYNPDLESVEPLANCPVLILVNVYGTKVADVSSLTTQSIVVNYNPVQEAE